MPEVLAHYLRLLIFTSKMALYKKTTGRKNLMSKQLRTPFGKVYPVELLSLVTIVLVTVAMLWFASTTTQYVLALIAVVTCVYGIYDLCRPVQSGGISSLHGILGVCSLIITFVMIVIYVTTFL